MMGTWATFASPVTEDDLFLPPSPEFHDDDPSSYLLYPPGFGPVVDWPTDGGNLPMLAREPDAAADPHGSGRKGADSVVNGGREEAAADGSGALELMGLSEALSGKVSLVGGRASGCGAKDAVVEYMVIGGLESNVNGEGAGGDVSRASGAGGSGEGGGSGVVGGLKDDGNGVKGASPVIAKVKVECDDHDEQVRLVQGCVSGCGEKDGVVEYLLIGGLDSNVNGEDSGGSASRASGAGGSGEGGGSGVVVVSKEDGNGVKGAPPVISKVKVKYDDDDEETNLGNGGSSESESDSSSSSSSSEESSKDKEDDSHVDEDDEDDRGGGKGKRMDEVVDLEEGEIRDVDPEELAMISDDDEDGGVKGPIRSKHELEVLPPVPPVNATLEPYHQMLPVGMISSVVGTKVIVEGLEKHNPLNEGSILWITETRSPLGLVDEIFGPVKNPYYVVRFNSEKEIPAGMSEGTAVSFVMEFANHILNEPELYKKGYDASGDNDEEVGDEVEFSDDEKEAEYKRSLRQTKRGTYNRRQRDQESIGKKRVQFDKRRFQSKSTGFGQRMGMQPLVHNASAPICQPPNIASQLQSTLWQPLAPGGLAPISQRANAPSLIQSTPQQPFNPGQVQAPPRPPRVRGQVQASAQIPHIPGQVQAPTQPPCVSGQVQAPSRPPCASGQVQAPPQPPYVSGQVQAPSGPPCASGHVQAPPQPPCVSGQVQAPPRPPCASGQVQASPQPPCVLGQLQAPPQQHCVPGQLQALQKSLQQPCAPAQLPAPTSLPYVLGPLQAPALPLHLPGLQAPPLAGNVGGGDLTSFVAGHSCFSGPLTLPAIPYGGQLGGPFGLTQQTLPMPQSNALWAAQQFITSLSSMFQNNGTPCPQHQDHHPFQQNQNQLFTGFNNGMPFQHCLIPNQGLPPNMMSWQGGLPNPSVGPRSVEPRGQDNLGQAPSGCTSTGEQGALGLSNGDQNRGQSEAASAHGDMHAPMKFSLGNSSVRDRKPHGRGG